MPMIQVPGTIASSIETQTGKGLVKLWEKSNFRGQDKYVLWTVWFDKPQLHLAERDEVIIDGRLSTKIGTYTDKVTLEERTTVEHHLNDAGIIQHHQAIGTEQAPTFTSTDEVPF